MRWNLFYKKWYLVITFIGIHNFSPVRLTCQDSRRLWSWWENTLMTVASTTRTHTRGATSTVWRTAPRSIQTPPLTSLNSARGSWGTLLSLESLTQSKRFGVFLQYFYHNGKRVKFLFLFLWECWWPFFKSIYILTKLRLKE